MMTEPCSPRPPGVGAGDSEISCPYLAAGPGGEASDFVTSLYLDNGQVVLGYVTGLIQDRYLAEDVVQETMLRAWRHCGQLSAEKGSVRGWLIRVAHNIAMDKMRMRRSRPAEVPADGMSEAMVEQDHAEAVVTAVEVRHALARLSRSHRDVLEQLYLNGCTAREAAARLGIPEGTVFSRAHYAVRILRRDLGGASAAPGHPGATQDRAA